MIEHYEMPHRLADCCPHAGVGKACAPCRSEFARIARLRAQALREAADSLEHMTTGTLGGVEWVRVRDLHARADLIEEEEL